MKKTLVFSVSVLLLLSSCGTYTGTGAYAGGTFGSIIGSAIGGIAGGPRGSDIGTLIGVAGGAAVGAAIGSAADNAEQRRYEEYVEARHQRTTVGNSRQDTYQDESGFDATGSGDDRLYGFGDDFSPSTPSSAEVSKAVQSVEIRNPRIIDASHDGVLTRGEKARMVFEIYNTSTKPIYHVLPSVTEVTGNKHVRISENVLVESIMPGKGIRYTAVIKSDDRLKDGEVVFKIGVFLHNREVTSQTQEFSVKTSKR